MVKRCVELISSGILENIQKIRFGFEIFKKVEFEVRKHRERERKTETERKRLKEKAKRKYKNSERGKYSEKKDIFRGLKYLLIVIERQKVV